MPQTFTVTFRGDLSDRESEKVAKALHKATAKWFKQGHDITIEWE